MDYQPNTTISPDRVHDGDRLLIDATGAPVTNAAGDVLIHGLATVTVTDARYKRIMATVDGTGATVNLDTDRDVWAARRVRVLYDVHTTPYLNRRHAFAALYNAPATRAGMDELSRARRYFLRSGHAEGTRDRLRSVAGVLATAATTHRAFMLGIMDTIDLFMTEPMTNAETARYRDAVHADGGYMGRLTPPPFTPSGRVMTTVLYADGRRRVLKIVDAPEPLGGWRAGLDDASERIERLPNGDTLWVRHLSADEAHVYDACAKGRTGA